ADPIIDKPIQMSFDTRGRLWVACTHHYPHIAPGKSNDDKIVILEDSKGTGRADRYQVFSDKELIPTGVLPAKGGAYVFHDTRLVFLKDTDGDGKADRRRVVLSGFGTEDSHHQGHTFRWSPGGNFHFNQGIFLHTAVETPHGLVRTLRGR